MIIELISSNTLKISLSKRDMSEFNIKYDILDKKNHETKLFLMNLIDIVKEQKDIDLCQEKLYVEAFPQTNGGCLLYLSVLNDVIKSKKDILSYITCDINSLLDLFTISQKAYKSYNYLIKKSELYNEKSNYRLIFYVYTETEKKIYRLLDEYNINYSTDEISVEYTKEYFSPVITRNAIEILAAYA